MSTLNLSPVTKEDQPTSHVVMGRSKVGSSNVVAVEHNNRTAFFYVDPEEDRVASNIRNNVHVNENVANVYGGIRRGQPFRVRTDVSLEDVEPCRSAKLHVEGVSEDQLREFLQSNRYLLHRDIGEEVALVGGRRVTFTVVDLDPSDWTTLKTTPETDIEFVDEEAAESATAHRNADELGRDPRGGDGTGGDGGGQSGDPGEMDVDIDITPEKPTVSFEEDVAGLDEVKQTARMILALFDPQTKEQVIDLYGEGFAARGGSMLLYGPPGCGKTLVSEAIAYEAANNTGIEEEYGDVKFLPVKGGDILSRYPGEAERRVEAVFDRAHSVAQDGFAVLFFDEIETLIPDRGDDDLQRHERSLTNAFLQEMGTDKIEDNLLVIGATNMPFTIDPAASRRFPVQQFIPQPGPDVMAQVWQKELTPLEEADGSDVTIDYEALGEASLGYTPAEIADRVLGKELQRELVHSVIDDDREPIVPDTAFLLERLDHNDPKTVRQYITSVRDEVSELEGYPEMRDYVEQQAADLGIDLGRQSGGLGIGGELFGQAQQAAAGESEGGEGDGGGSSGAGAETEQGADPGPDPDGEAATEE